MSARAGMRNSFKLSGWRDASSYSISFCRGNAVARSESSTATVRHASMPWSTLFVKNLNDRNLSYALLLRQETVQ